MNETTVEKTFRNLLRDHSWKGPAILGIIAFAVLILLDSFLFALILDLLKLGLFILGAVALGRSAYLGYPILLAKYKEVQSQKKEI